MGSEGGEEPWRYCTHFTTLSFHPSIICRFTALTGVADTTKVMGFAVGAMFVRETFHGQAKVQGELSNTETMVSLVNKKLSFR